MGGSVFQCRIKINPYVAGHCRLSMHNVYIGLHVLRQI